MISAHTLAHDELEEIRKKNQEELERRKDLVRSSAPDFAEAEAVLSQCGIALSRCILSGTRDISAIRAQIESAQKKKAEILKRLSSPSDYLNDIYSCEKCRDTGFDENGHRCRCLKQMISKYVGVNSNLTAAMRDQTFDNFDFSLFENCPDIKGCSAQTLAKKIFNKCLDFANTFEEKGSNLYLYGGAGTGKTYLSSCIANKALERGFAVYYQSAFQLLDTFEKLKFGRFDQEELPSAEYAVKYAYTADLLIIDDVGTEFVSGYSSAALFDIINSRLVAGKSTIISSNLTPSKIEEIYGGRIASRITGSFDVLAFRGADLRRIARG